MAMQTLTELLNELPQQSTRASGNTFYVPSRMPLALHLAMRNFNHELYQDVVLDDESYILTVMLHNLSGQVVGYQRYNPLSDDKTGKDPENTRYYTYRKAGQNAVWGLEFCDFIEPYVFVVEGIFKASALHLLGLNAIAILSSTPSQSLLNWLNTMPITPIAFGDNDAAGRKLVEIIGRGQTTEKDLDEMQSLEVYNLAIKHLRGVI